jgi:WD40 repeat protein
MADRDYKDTSYGIAFGPDGALYAVGYDGFVRRYGPDLKRTAKVETLGGKQPYSVAVHPQGKRIAVGYSDTTAVDILDAKTLQRLVAADVNGVNKDLFSVAWSSDGKRLWLAVNLSSCSMVFGGVQFASGMAMASSLALMFLLRTIRFFH